MAAPVTPANAGSASYSMSSLYVGDLHPEVNEAVLFEKFSAAGPVLSIRVCRDNASRLSLGYAYVNFQQPADAERALDTMNFDSLHGKPMRIMWSQRDPAARRSGAGNIFIKNLDKVIDNKSIYDTFSLFGNILSCKVATDEESHSKGYGFVHFETEEAAQNAIQKVNGMLLAGKKVFVGKFQPRAQRLRDMGETTKRFTNVFVKNFGEQMTKEELEKMFSKYGEITSVAVMCDGEGKSKGFGFVAFKNAEEAEQAVNEMHEKAVEGSENKLTVCRAQKKSERQAELKRKYEAQKAERMQRYQGVNLYVKNLDDTFDDETLRKQFENFGKITSAKVMTDENGRSKGFGFVCFENAEEATKAVTDMNSKMVCSKPLYVAIAQRKEDRRAQLASQYMQRLASMRMHNTGMSGGTMYQPSAGGYFVNQVQPQGRFMGGGVAGAGGMRMAQGRGWAVQNSQYGQPFMMQGSGPMFQRNNTRPGGAAPSAGGRPPQFNQPGAGVSQANRMGQGSRVPQPGAVAGQPQAAAQRPQTGPRPGVPTGAKPGAPVMYQQQYPQQNQPPRQPQSGIIVGGQEPLTSQMLASAAPQEQKQLLGERIYALLNSLYPTAVKEAGKITGMMLEIDNSELVMMLQDTELFRSKVQEASNVLEQSTAKNT